MSETKDEIAAIRKRQAEWRPHIPYTVGQAIDTLLARVDHQAATIRTLREALANHEDDGRFDANDRSDG